MPIDNVIKLKPTRPCPVCRKPSSQQYFPFCSARCTDIDLNRWLSGAYVIPARDTSAENDDEEETPAAPPDSDDEDI